MLLIIAVGREKLNLSNIDEKNFKSVWLPLKMLSLQRWHQATYHDGHKIAFFLWRKWIRTMECGIVTIKKLLWKLYKSDYIQSFQSAH